MAGNASADGPVGRRYRCRNGDWRKGVLASGDSEAAMGGHHGHAVTNGKRLFIIFKQVAASKRHNGGSGQQFSKKTAAAVRRRLVHEKLSADGVERKK